MKKIFGLFLLFAMLFSAPVLFAQDDDLDDLDFSEDEEYNDMKSTYFALGGGYMANLFQPNFDELNNLVVDKLGFDKLDGYLLMHGGEGFVAVGSYNIRVGFLSYGGTEFVEDQQEGSINRKFEYYAGVNGLSINYALYTPFENTMLIIMPGVNIGWGTLALEYSQSSSDANWYNIKPEADSENFTNRMESGFLFVQPTINLEWAPTSFMVVRVAVSYTVTGQYEWEYNGLSSFGDEGAVPEEVNANGMSVQLGVFFGLFGY